MTRALEATLLRLLGPAGPEVSCEECFEALDRYVDAEIRGEDPETRVPGMAAHLEGCPACAEDHESLLALVAGEAARAGEDAERPPHADGRTAKRKDTE